MSESRTAQVATLPEREEMLKTMIGSIYDQVDRIVVALNGYRSIPDWMYGIAKIKPVVLDNSKGDAAKFYSIEYRRGYIFTCDDDIWYSPDYTEKMISDVERYQRKAIISLHGRTMLPKPIRSYYRDRVEAYRCTFDVDKDYRVNSAGTGVMAWHSSTIHLKYSDFQSANMADIWMAKFAHQQGIPLVVVAHRGDWIKDLDPEMKLPTIWKDHYYDDKAMTELYNSF